MEYLSNIQRLVLILFITMLFVGVIRDMRGKRRSAGPKKSFTWLPMLIVLAIFTLNLNFYVVNYRLQLFFASTFVLGILITYCAERYLAKAEEQALVTAGPYAILRHPIWAGLIILYISFLFLFFNPVTIALTAVYLAVLTFTAVSEERFLHETLPGYPEYAQRTGRFLPKLRRKKK